MSSVLTWGPTVAPSPPSGLDLADGLQPFVDAYIAGTGSPIIVLPRGVYYADPGSPSTPLNMPAAAGGMTIIGERRDDTIIKSPILMGASQIGLQRLRVSPDGTDYGIKVYNGGSPFIARNWMREVWVGATDKNSAIAGLGPRDGLVLDGCGVFLAEGLTLAFNQRHGLYAAQTGAEPNTTLKFDMCSFVQNGFGPLAGGVGYGINLQASLNIAEFNNGNAEGNKYREATINGITNPRFRDFFFETDQTMAEQIHFGGCTAALIDNCFFSNATGATRGPHFQSCAGVRVLPCRYSGWTNVGVVRLDEACSNAWVDNNQSLLNNCWVEDYSR